jgi:hypothetical protein
VCRVANRFASISRRVLTAARISASELVLLLLDPVGFSAPVVEDPGAASISRRCACCFSLSVAQLVGGMCLLR